MKRLFFYLCTVSILAMTGCKSGSSNTDPKATLTSFFKALSKKDLKEARKYSTKESESMLSLMELGMAMAEKMNVKENENKEFDKFNENNVEMGEATIDGDKATVPVKNKK